MAVSTHVHYPVLCMCAIQVFVVTLFNLQDEYASEVKIS